MYSNPLIHYPYDTPSFPYHSTIDTTPTTPSFPSFPWEIFSPYYTHVVSSSPSLFLNHGFSPHTPYSYPCNIPLVSPQPYIYHTPPSTLYPTHSPIPNRTYLVHNKSCRLSVKKEKQKRRKRRLNRKRVFETKTPTKFHQDRDFVSFSCFTALDGFSRGNQMVSNDDDKETSPFLSSTNFINEDEKVPSAEENSNVRITGSARMGKYAAEIMREISEVSYAHGNAGNENASIESTPQHLATSISPSTTSFFNSYVTDAKVLLFYDGLENNAYKVFDKIPLYEHGLDTDTEPHMSEAILYTGDQHPTEETDIEIDVASKVSVETERCFEKGVKADANCFEILFELGGKSKSVEDCLVVVERKVNAQLDRQPVLDSNWNKALLRVRGKLKGMEWDHDDSHRTGIGIAFSESVFNISRHHTNTEDEVIFPVLDISQPLKVILKPTIRSFSTTITSSCKAIASFDSDSTNYLPQQETAEIYETLMGPLSFSVDPPAIAEKYKLILPPYPGTSMFVRIGKPPQIDISALQWNYISPEFLEDQVEANPFDQFSKWFDDALAACLKEPNAIAFSTVRKDGKPSSQIVLPDEFDVPAIIKDLVPPGVADINGKGEAQFNAGNEKTTIVLGRNIHTTCIEVTEPDDDDDITGERDAHIASVLARYRKSLTERTKYHLGYPNNLDSDYGALSQLQHFSINNLGDPFIKSNYGVHSRQFEVVVLDWFARLWELGKNEYWGYITYCVTEGNLHGILVGRKVLPYGILYASRESHYSIFKATRMYRMECVKTETLNSGDIDCDNFKAKLLCHRNKPTMIYVNIGTTMKGVVDELDLVIQKLDGAGFSLDRFNIHIDGALFGFMMPFVKRTLKVAIKKPSESVSVSGHKLVGCFMPCGVHINALSRNLFERPHNEKLVHKWHLACKGNITHVVVMPNVTVHKLDEFLKELVQ